MGATFRSQIFLQAWVLLAGIALVAAYVANDQGYFRQVIDADQSRLCILIAGLFLASTAHAAWHIVRVTRQIGAASFWLSHSLDKAEDTAIAEDPSESHFVDPDQFVSGFVGEVRTSQDSGGHQPGDRALVLEIYADRLRACVDIGWYLVDILIRLGLIGTIVGFILILSSLSSGPAPTPENIQTLLISMSGGMGTALYTTLAGLVTSMVLGAQYLVLGRGTEELIALLVRIRDRTMA
jgi:biopolymer transport protein ExbB/TolQ